MTKPFVFVLWTDAASDHGWQDATETEDFGVGGVWSSGWMWRHDKRETLLVSDVGATDEGEVETEEGTNNRRLAIPHRMIEKIHQDSPTGPILYQRRKARESKSATKNPSTDVREVR